jgi:hypothetical protein
MTATFKLSVFGWTIGTFDVRIDIDQAAAAAAQPVIDGVCKKLSRRWTARMTS